MSKILIVSSSMRVGNSDILCDEFQKGAQEAKNEVDRINLRDKKIGFCRGCSFCLESEKCSIDDDMQEILDKVKEADVLVLATPVYFGEISGQLKVFIDRLYPIYTSLNVKEVIVIATCYQDNRKHIDESLNSIKRFLQNLDGVSITDIIYGENCDDVCDVSYEQKKQAYMRGKELIGE